MAPLVVLRGGSQRVEYRETRAEWMRVQHLKLHDAARDARGRDAARAISISGEDNYHNDFQDDDDDDDDDDELRTFVRPRTRTQPRDELLTLAGQRAFSCADCGSLVGDRDDVVAKTFFGRTGKAFLLNNMFNVAVGAPRSRYLMTGMHTISDVSCAVCGSVLGWKYLKAMEASQKYKEGKFILEKALVQDEAEEQAWHRH
ncbi:hypothetical protein PybrP1_003224 [[Pythium] brassicae (nom. inval.)]|nr:hypothetical protein PybrP1_003224 [[Pythium] brassicae (nom. inval.)]